MDVIGPMLDQALSERPGWSEDFMLPLFRYDFLNNPVRNGYLEETYMTWSFSPVRIEDGTPGGLLAPIIETTQRVISERRMDCLREVASHSNDITSKKGAFALLKTILPGWDMDLSFFVFYSADQDQNLIREFQSDSLEASQDCNQETILREHLPRSKWNIESVIRESKMVQIDDLESKFGPLPGE